MIKISLKMTYPKIISNLLGASELTSWMVNYITWFCVDMITYPCPNLNDVSDNLSKIGLR